MKPDQPSDAGLPDVAFLIIVALLVRERARLAAEEARLVVIAEADDPGADYPAPPPLTSSE